MIGLLQHTLDIRLPSLEVHGSLQENKQIKQIYEIIKSITPKFSNTGNNVTATAAHRVTEATGIIIKRTKYSFIFIQPLFLCTFPAENTQEHSTILSSVFKPGVLKLFP